MPDLIGGYGDNGRGIVTVLRGNVDFGHPNTAEAQARRANGTFSDAPFLSPAAVFEAPVAADFIGSGDFDADGHGDIVSASRGGSVLYYFSATTRRAQTSQRQSMFSELAKINQPSDG